MYPLWQHLKLARGNRWSHPEYQSPPKS